MAPRSNGGRLQGESEGDDMTFIDLIGVLALGGIAFLWVHSGAVLYGSIRHREHRT